jgi:hypothetical protein
VRFTDSSKLGNSFKVGFYLRRADQDSGDGCCEGETNTIIVPTVAAAQTALLQAKMRDRTIDGDGRNIAMPRSIKDNEEAPNTMRSPSSGERIAIGRVIKKIENNIAMIRTGSRSFGSLRVGNDRGHAK